MDAKVSSANQLVINVLIFDFVFLSKKKKKKGGVKKPSLRHGGCWSSL
jgi:hypothetical protein